MSSDKVNEIPDGLWVKCERCQEMLYQKELEKDLMVCRRCGFHFRLPASERIRVTVDPDSFVERDVKMRSSNPLSFPGYPDKLAQGKEKTGLNEGLVWGTCTMEGMPAVLAVADFGFMGGSMGSVVGEKMTRALEYAAASRLPVIAFCTSGGARMQEGILSLMQMAKTAAAYSKLDDAGQLYITVFTDPLTAGVLASFASLGDIIVTEPEALIGFAGPRVIEQNLKIKLPPGTHTAQFQLEHGMVDMVVPRREMRPLLAKLLKYLS